MITLIIKGDLRAAYDAADENDVELHSIATHNKFNECIASTPDRFMPYLVRWYCKENFHEVMGYPAGTLMFYSAPH